MLTWSVASYIFNRHSLDLVFQLHVPFLLHLRKSSRYALDSRLGGLQSQSGCGGKKETPLSLQEPTYGRLAHRLIIIPTELCRFQRKQTKFLLNQNSEYRIEVIFFKQSLAVGIRSGWLHCSRAIVEAIQNIVLPPFLSWLTRKSKMNSKKAQRSQPVWRKMFLLHPVVIVLVVR
jgi:hypothetical protein